MKTRSSALACLLLVVGLPALPACSDGPPSATDAGLDGEVVDMDRADIDTVDLGAEDSGAPDAADLGEEDAGAPDAGDLGSIARPSFVATTTGPVTFDPYDCGGSIPSVRYIDIENQGDGEGTLQILEARSPNDFGDLPWLDVVAPAPTIAPGETMRVELRFTPPATEAPGDRSGWVYFKATEVDGVTSAQVSASVRGSVLSVSGGTHSFGDVPVGSMADTQTIFTIGNAGNQGSIVVDFESVLGSAYTVTGDALTPTFSLAAGESRSVIITFEPGSTGLDVGWLRASTASTVCVPVEGSDTLQLEGSGVFNTLSISTRELDFGGTVCGATAAPKPVTLENPGATPVGFSATLLGGGSRFSLSATSGVIPAGEAVTLVVTPLPAPSLANTLPADLSDELVVTTDVLGDSPRSVVLSQRLDGGLLRWAAPMPAFVTPLGESMTQTVEVRNDGNREVAANLLQRFAVGAFSLAPATAVTVPAFGSANVEVRFSPLQLGRYTDSVQLVATGSATGLCNAQALAQAPLEVAGFVSDGLSFSSDTAHLSAACGARPVGGVTISNPTLFNATGEFTLSPAGVYALSSEGQPLTGTITVIGQRQRTLFIERIAPFPASGPVGPEDTGLLTLEFEGGVTHSVTILPEITGAVLEAEASTVGPLEIPSQRWTRLEGAVLNHGTEAYPLVANLPTGETRSVTVPPATTSGPGRVSIEFDYFMATVGAPAIAPRITFSELGGNTSAPRCSSLPADIEFQLVGLAGDLVVHAGTLDLGDYVCGSAPVARTLSVTNRGMGPLDWSAALPLDSPFEIDLPAGWHTLAPGASAILSVRGAPLGNAATPGQVQDVLTMRSNLPGDTDRQVAVSMTIRGFRVELPSTVRIPDVPPNTLAYRSFGAAFSGNAPALLTFDVSATDVDGEFYVGTAPNVQPFDRPPPLVAAFVPRSLGSRSVVAVPSVPEGAGLCNPGELHDVILEGSSSPRTLRITPTSIVWGEVSCGESPEARELTLVNVTDQAVSFSLGSVYTAGGRFMISPSSGNIPAGGTASVMVTPNALWPLAPTWIEGGRLAVGETYRDTMEVRVGTQVYTAEVVVNTTGAAYQLMPEWLTRTTQQSAAVSHFLTTRRFLPTGDFTSSTFVSGSCTSSPLGAPLCGPGLGSTTFTPSTGLAAGLCTAVGAPIMLSYP